jgi:hypothetical protein
MKIFGFVFEVMKAKTLKGDVMHINQNVISKMTHAVLMSCFVMMATSCDKPQRAVRATVKTQQVISPGPSSQADQQAAAMNVKYSLATIAVPEQTNAGYTVNVELQDPSNAFLPFTTRHENGTNLIDGVYNDTSRGLVVHIEARCSSNACDKYTILVTTFKNNVAVYQTFGLSYKDDCRFFVNNSTASFGNMYTNLSVAESATSSIVPKNDIDNCPVN